MSTQTPKQILFGQFAALAKCLSHPHRLELLEQLAQGERSVEILADKLGLSTANASQHLQQMLRAGLVTSVRKGKFVVYGLTDHAVLELLSSLRLIAERNSAEVDKLVRNYFDKLDALEPVTREELARLVGPTGSVLAVDCSDGFLEYGRRDARAAGIGNVTFLAADVQTHPFQPVHDLCFSSFGTQFF